MLQLQHHYTFTRWRIDMRYYPFGSGSALYTPISASVARYAVNADHYINVLSASFALQGPSGSQGAPGQCIQQSGSAGPQGPSGSQGPVGTVGLPGTAL
jgi:hypothetical protein